MNRADYLEEDKAPVVKAIDTKTYLGLRVYDYELYLIEESIGNIDFHFRKNDHHIRISLSRTAIENSKISIPDMLAEEIRRRDIYEAEETGIYPRQISYANPFRNTRPQRMI